MSSDADFLPLTSPFPVVRKGYDKELVEEYLERADAELRVTTADRDATASQSADLASQLDAARSEIDALRSETDRLVVAPHDTEGLSDRLQRMLRLAQDEASEIRARAEAEAAEVRSVAEQEAAELRARFEQLIAEVEQRRSHMESEHTAAMDASDAEAARIVAAAVAGRDAADASSVARRARIEEDFELAMGGRRAEALATLQLDEATSKAEAERRVRDATTEAQRRLARATEQSEHRLAAATASLERMKQLRQRVADQIAAVAALSATAPDLLEPLPEESAPVDTPTAATAPTAPTAPTAATANGVTPSPTPR